MADTPYNHYALYEPDASPDLTATGEYNRAVMAIDSDMHSERMEREQEDTNLQIAIDNETDTRKAEDAKLANGIATETAERKADTQAAREERTRIEREYKAADASLNKRITTLNNQEIADVRDVNAKLAQEVTDRKAADAALDSKFTNGLNSVTNGLITVGNDVSKVESDYKAADAALAVRINNAEAEISANSADLTGIKGLTYGDDHIQFLEHDNGSYASPALDEIDEQVKALKSCGFTVIKPTSQTLTANEHSTLKSAWPMVVIKTGSTLYFPSNYTQSGHLFISMRYTSASDSEGKPTASHPEMSWLTVKWNGSLGTGNALSLGADTLPSDFTVVVTSGNKLTDEQFNTIKANWPKVALSNHDVLLLPTTKSSIAYIFSATFFANITSADNTVTLQTPVVAAITVKLDKSMEITSFKLAEHGAITPNTQWGQIEA